MLLLCTTVARNRLSPKEQWRQEEDAWQKPPRRGGLSSALPVPEVLSAWTARHWPGCPFAVANRLPSLPSMGKGLQHDSLLFSTALFNVIHRQGANYIRNFPLPGTMLEISFLPGYSKALGFFWVYLIQTGHAGKLGLLKQHITKQRKKVM